MKHLGYRIALLLAAVNAPLLAHSYTSLSPPSGLTAFRVWAAVVAGLSLVLHIGAAFAIAGWLRARDQGRRQASVRDILLGFRGQALVALGFAAAMWWLSREAGSVLARGAGSSADLSPLGTYGGIGVAVLLLLGSLTAVTVASRRTDLPSARTRR